MRHVTVIEPPSAWRAKFGIGISATAAWAVPSLVILSTFVTAVGLFLAALQVRYRDVSLAMPVILQVWLFATPVLYPLEMARHALPPPVYALYVLNPMAGVVDTFRRALVLHQGPAPSSLSLPKAR